MNRRDFIKSCIAAGIGIWSASISFSRFFGSGKIQAADLNRVSTSEDRKENKMKVMTVFGSQRKGNSEFMAERFSQIMEGSGAEVTRWYLNELDYNGCTVCNACKNGKEECVLRDDLTPALNIMKESDILVLATPLYFYDTSSLVKTMVERWYSYLLPRYYTGENRQTRLPEGKQVVMCVSQGAPVEMFQDFTQRMNSIFQMFNTRPAHLLKCGFGIDPNVAENNESLIAEIEKTAELVLAGKDPSTPIAPYGAPI